MAGESASYQLGVRRRAAIVSTFTPLSVIFTIVYSIVTFQDPSLTWYGYILLAAFILLVVNIPLARMTGNITRATHFLVFLGYPVVLPWLITGGPLREGFFWTIPYIAWAFLLVGKKWATIWLTGYFALSTLILILGSLGYFHVAYSWIEFAQIAFMSATTAAFIYIYDQQSSFFEKLAYKALDTLEKRSGNN